MSHVTPVNESHDEHELIWSAVCEGNAIPLTAMPLSHMQYLWLQCLCHICNTFDCNAFVTYAIPFTAMPLSHMQYLWLQCLCHICNTFDCNAFVTYAIPLTAMPLWHRAYAMQCLCHIWIIQVIHTNESCHTYESVVSNKWMCHVTHISAVALPRASTEMYMRVWI